MIEIIQQKRFPCHQISSMIKTELLHLATPPILSYPTDSRVSSEEEGGVSVSLVASQLRGYAVWDGGLAQDGSLFQGCPGRAAPSLLFLWVSEAQANLVQTELSALHPITLPGKTTVPTGRIKTRLESPC